MEHFEHFFIGIVLKRFWLIELVLPFAGIQNAVHTQKHTHPHTLTLFLLVGNKSSTFNGSVTGFKKTSLSIQDLCPLRWNLLEIHLEEG